MTKVLTYSPVKLWFELSMTIKATQYVCIFLKGWMSENYKQEEIKQKLLPLLVACYLYVGAMVTV